MRVVPALLLIFFALPAVFPQAGVYKSVGPDGRVQYTDRPVAGAESVRVPDVKPSPLRGESNTPQPTREQADLGSYDAFEIVSPEPNTTVRSDTGDLAVSLVLAPVLLPGHKLRILLDGQPVPGEVPGTQLTLKGLPYGSHSLQAQVLDDLDVPVASTPTVGFHLRKPLPEGALP